MEDYKQRVIEEKTELDAKLSKLRAFIIERDAPEASPVGQVLLCWQATLMDQYSHVLELRIAEWT